MTASDGSRDLNDVIVWVERWDGSTAVTPGSEMNNHNVSMCLWWCAFGFMKGLLLWCNGKFTTTLHFKSSICSCFLTIYGLVRNICTDTTSWWLVMTFPLASSGSWHLLFCVTCPNTFSASSDPLTFLLAQAPLATPSCSRSRIWEALFP